MELLRGVNLSAFTTIRIGGVADYLFLPENPQEVRSAVLFAQERDLPLFVLGGGSNSIPGDIKGVVLCLSKLRSFEEEHLPNGVRIRLLAGTPLKDIISYAIKRNLKGIYRLAGFPATIGGAISMNAGAFEVEISDFLKEVTFLTWDGDVVSVEARDIEFSYRKSPFPKEGIVLSCTLELDYSPEPVLEDFKRIRKWRREKQPINLPTSGSTFKNPKGKKAGELLEAVGMRGFRKGQVAFSEKHSNFLINLGEASFREAVELLQEAKRRVYEEFGIILEEEVKLIESSCADGWKVL